MKDEYFWSFQQSMWLLKSQRNWNEYIIVQKWNKLPDILPIYITKKWVSFYFIYVTEPFIWITAPSEKASIKREFVEWFRIVLNTKNYGQQHNQNHNLNLSDILIQ